MKNHFAYKRYNAGTIKVGILREEDYSGLFGWTQCNYKDRYKREGGRSS